MPEGEDRDNREFEDKDDKSPRGESSNPPDPRFDAPTETFIDSTQIIGTEIGRYHILSILGEGGGGIVYLAQQNHPIKRRVALKVIKPGMDSKQVIARFEAERQALALLDHPNIAHVFDAGATDLGRPYFVMEFVKGIPITEFCDQGKLTLPERLRLFIPLCHAIQHAHQKGIIHRDIKPSNALVMLQDDKPVPKIIDFGVAKALHQPLTDRTMVTLQGQFVGTPEYMSPEQAEISNLDVDTRSDIYSLGVLLYEMLTGCTPFDSKDLRSKGYAEMQRIIREQDPIKPSTRLTTMGGKLEDIARRRSATADQLRKSVRDDLDWIVMKAMEKDRARRYATTSDLAEDLERHLNNEPVLARPPSKVYRFQKMVRRNKGLFAAVAVVAAVLVLGAVISTWQAVLATRAKRAESHLLYIANMNLVQQAWEQNNIGQARQLLDETAAYPHREFEWYYWQRQMHLELKTLRGHLGGIFVAAFSPDGQRIVTGSEDKTAKVWDVANGKELLTLQGHSAPVLSVAFSPDGQRIVTGSADQTAKVWDTATGKGLVTLKKHISRIWSVAFFPDGQRLVTVSADQTVKVWEVASGKELLTINLNGQNALVGLVAFSPDGQRLVTVSIDQTAKVWEVASGKELLTLNLKGHSDWIRSVAFSPDGQRIVTGSYEQMAWVWEAASGKELFTLKGHTGPIVSVAFSPDGQRIVTGSDDNTAKVWEAASGKELFTIKGHSAPVVSVAFSPVGQRIVTGSVDQTAKVWETASNTETLTLKGHSDAIRSVAFSQDGQRIVTGSSDQMARVWEATTAKELLPIKGHTGPILSVAFSPDGQRIVTGSFDQTTKVWDASSGKELLPLQGHSDTVASVAFSPDGQWIVTGSCDQTAKIWEASIGKELRTLKGHSDEILSVAFSSDGQRIVTGSADKTAMVWDASSGKKLLDLKGHSGYIWSVAFSPDGQRIVTGSADQTAKVWEATTAKELLPIKGHTGPILSVAFSPDGQRIVTGSADQTAKVWEAASGKELLTLKGHSGWISSVAISRNSQRIVTGSYDQTAKVWDTASVEQVTSWHREEQTAAESLAMQQRKRVADEEHDRAIRVQDPGAIKRWLILLPIPFEGGNGAKALQDEQIEGESQLHPHVGDRIKAMGNDLIWRVVQLDDDRIDFIRLIGVPTQWSVVYAVANIQSDTAQNGVLLKVGSDDQAKVYLNGKLIYRYAIGRNYADQDVVAEVDLEAGLNVLVFKVVNETGGWKGSIRLTDADGKPLKGIYVTLDPEAK